VASGAGEVPETEAAETEAADIEAAGTDAAGIDKATVITGKTAAISNVFEGLHTAPAPPSTTEIRRDAA